MNSVTFTSLAIGIPVLISLFSIFILDKVLWDESKTIIEVFRIIYGILAFLTFFIFELILLKAYLS